MYLHTGTSFALVTAFGAQPANQHRGKQCVEICTDMGELFGQKAEVRGDVKIPHSRMTKTCLETVVTCL